MTGIAHYFGGDLILDGGGGLELVSDAEETRQRLLRRLLTNAGDYPWQTDYGAGLQAMVGQVIAPFSMEATIRAQVEADSGVDATQPVTVAVTDRGEGVCVCTVTYVDAGTGEQQSVSLSS